jgi:hypothetical protein
LCFCSCSLLASLSSSPSLFATLCGAFSSADLSRSQKLKETPDGYKDMEDRIRVLQRRFEIESSSQLAQSHARPDEDDQSNSEEEDSESYWYSGSGSDEEPGSFGMAGGLCVEDI